jgi:hypothetical protein
LAIARSLDLKFFTEEQREEFNTILMVKLRNAIALFYNFQKGAEIVERIAKSKLYLVLNELKSYLILIESKLDELNANPTISLLIKKHMVLTAFCSLYREHRLLQYNDILKGNKPLTFDFQKMLEITFKNTIKSKVLLEDPVFNSYLIDLVIDKEFLDNFTIRTEDNPKAFFNKLDEIFEKDLMYDLDYLNHIVQNCFY